MTVKLDNIIVMVYIHNKINIEFNNYWPKIIVCLCMCVFVHVCVLCMHVCVVHVCGCMCVGVCVDVYVWMYMCGCVSVDKCVYSPVQDVCVEVIV